ncbi:MAG: hypothetical protein C5B51_28500 [Terriglobia bacterium]|nr:MAG: hypothetical protein C5B51_28500 [Terriglobia bacterium]
MPHSCARTHNRHPRRGSIMQDGGAPMSSVSLLEKTRSTASPEMIDRDEELAAPSQDEIAALAYSYWEARGGHGGSPWDDWFRAEEELKRRGEL